MPDLPVGRVSGPALKALVTAVRKTPLRRVIVKALRSQLGIDAIDALMEPSGVSLPQNHYPVQARDSHERPSEKLPLPETSPSLCTARRIQTGYDQGQVSPTELVTRAIDAAKQLSERSPSLGAFRAFTEAAALNAAKKSTERLQAGQALGPLDGIVVPIKEEVMVAGLPTGLGATFTSQQPSNVDAVAVARLRQAGAIIIGNTVMTELGLSTLGANANRKMPRNAQSDGHLPGGSSTGSAVAVATGIGPVALGADGGGSVRVPAALNGLFGLKPTYGTIPLTGHGAPWGGSVTHLGPIAISTHDLAVFVEATWGPDIHDIASTQQPERAAGELVSALGRGVRNLRIGVDERTWQKAEREVSSACKQALDALVKQGATLVSIEPRLSRYATAVGYLTIGLENFSALREVRARSMDQLTLDLQLTLAGLAHFKPDDYLAAQRTRAALREETAELLRDVDLIALPTTACTAPSVTDSEAASGFIDPPALDGLCAFAFWANLTGLPAGTAPVGRDSAGLPIGLQLLGDAWDEACVLAALAALERSGTAQAVRSPAYVDVLNA